MKKNSSYHFFALVPGLALLLGLFIGVLSYLKNPEEGQSEPESRPVLEKKPKVLPHPERMADVQSLPAEPKLKAPDKADELYQEALMAVRDEFDEEKARGLLQEVLLKNPNHIAAADELFALYEKDQDWEGALATFQKLERDSDQNPQAGLDYAAGRLYQVLGHPDEARSRLEAALETNADSPLIREQLAEVYSSLGDKEEARREWQRLADDTAAGSASWNAKIKLAEDLFAEGRWTEAEAYAREILKQDPQNKVGIVLSGR